MWQSMPNMKLFTFVCTLSQQWSKNWGTLCASYSQSLKNLWLEGPSQMKKCLTFWKGILKGSLPNLRYTLWFIGWYSRHTWVTRITSISIENNLFMADFEWRASLSHSEFQAHRLSHILHCHVQIWSATQTGIAHHGRPQWI